VILEMDNYYQEMKDMFKELEALSFQLLKAVEDVYKQLIN
jgi:hypothetical protein